MAKLLGCPFCGKRPKVRDDGLLDGCVILCASPTCHASEVVVREANRTLAETRWNKRKTR